MSYRQIKYKIKTLFQLKILSIALINVPICNNN